MDVDIELRASDAVPNTQALLSLYQEVCKSIHEVDDFRMKLLGLLPLTSLIGIFAIGDKSILTLQSPESMKLVALWFFCGLSYSLSFHI